MSAGVFVAGVGWDLDPESEYFPKRKAIVQTPSLVAADWTNSDGEHAIHHAGEGSSFLCST